MIATYHAGVVCAATPAQHEGREPASAASCQFLCYHEIKATRSDKSSDDHHDEQLCCNAAGWQRHCDDKGVHTNSVNVTSQ